jgi:hypothetical protein
MKSLPWLAADRGEHGKEGYPRDQLSLSVSHPPLTKKASVLTGVPEVGNQAASAWLQNPDDLGQSLLSFFAPGDIVEDVQ